MVICEEWDSCSFEYGKGFCSVNTGERVNFWRLLFSVCVIPRLVSFAVLEASV